MSIERGLGIEPDFERREALRNIAEEAEVVTCQRQILARACGRELDPSADTALLDSLNSSALETNQNGVYVLDCRVAACDRVDTITIETGGVLRQLNGDGACHETTVMIGRSLLTSQNF